MYFVYCISTTEIQKMLTALSKEKDCEIIGRWKKACVRHFYWAMTSTKPQMSEVILAKFEAFQSHILNVHSKLPNKVFEKCAHAAINTPRVWMSKSNYWFCRCCNTSSLFCCMQTFCVFGGRNKNLYFNFQTQTQRYLKFVLCTLINLQHNTNCILITNQADDL